MMPEQPQKDPSSAEMPPTVDSESPPVVPETTRSIPLSDPSTGCVPSFRSPVTPAAPSRTARPSSPGPGDRIDDFEIIQVLGKGAFATVFLARQVSLGRQVALKVSANRGAEGRTLASLEHNHIVHVFSETVDPARNLRLMCMQYVAGTTLERVIRLLSGRDRRTWSGAAILEVIDALSSTTPVAFDPAALRDRESLAGSDFVEAVCWIGIRLAEALAHAHNQGVLHRDIKPANILLNRYGRPMLADFNVALDADRARGPAGEIFGGTLGYMAPEHLDAFNPDVGVGPAAVDERSDLYSLGLVLYEMLTGSLPFGSVPKTTRVGESLQLMANERRTEAPSPRRLVDVPEILDRTIRRCLDPKPEARYQSAAELARALEGCREHHGVEKAMPGGNVITRLTLAHPVLLGVFLLFLPHLFASAVNIPYNALRIVGELTPQQQATFEQLILGYNLIAYPVCVWVVYRVMRPIARVWRQLSSPALPDNAAVEAARHQALRLPAVAIALSFIGWLPGGILFPLGIDLLAGPIVNRSDVYLHFLVSFTLSGLIALTYSVFVAQFLVLRVLYPRLWLDAQDLRGRASMELRPLGRRLWVFQLLAGLIPLAGAVLMIDVGPEAFAADRTSYRTFRLLVTALIALGMVGFGIAVGVTNQLRLMLTALMAEERRRSTFSIAHPTMIREERPTAMVGEENQSSG